MLLLTACMLPVVLNAQAVVREGGSNDTIPRAVTLQEQTAPATAIDSLRQAVHVIQGLTGRDTSLLPIDPGLRLALENLVFYIEHLPIDSTVGFLERYSLKRLYTSVQITADTIKPPAGVEPELSVTDSLPQDTVPFYPGDTLRLELVESKMTGITDAAALAVLDTTRLIIPDSLAEARPVSLPDTTLLVETLVRFDTLCVVDPLRYRLADSLWQAVEVLLRHVENDSARIWVSNIGNDSLAMWLTNSHRNYYRFWVKNQANDSLGLWLEGVDRGGIRIFMDEGVYIRTLRHRETIDRVEFEKLVDERLKSVARVRVIQPEWTKGAVASLQFSQGYLSHWVKGGESSIAMLVHLEGFYNYAKGNSKWENSGQIKTGIIQSGDKGLRKNEDLFEFNSIYGQKLVKNWYLSAGGNLKSQFFRGYDYKDTTIVSNFLAPGYLVLSLGMDYKPNKNFSLLLSPLTSKTTIVRDIKNVDPTKYGLSTDTRLRREMGGFVKTRINTTFTEDISIENRLELFSSYTNKPQNIDVNWEAILRMRINLYMEANISTHLIYDDDVDVPITKIVDGETVKTTSKKIQFKELLSVGFRYRF